MNTLMFITGLLLCVCMAYYATALPADTVAAPSDAGESLETLESRWGGGRGYGGGRGWGGGYGGGRGWGGGYGRGWGGGYGGGRGWGGGYGGGYGRGWGR